jgi:hypothetical protein
VALGELDNTEKEWTGVNQGKDCVRSANARLEATSEKGTQH